MNDWNETKTTRSEAAEEKLDLLLAAMAEEGQREKAAPESVPAPPVVNLYRLSREKERRESDRQLLMTAAAAVVSMLLTIVAAAVLLRLATAHRSEIVRLPEVAAFLHRSSAFRAAYGQQTAIAVAAGALLLMAGCVIGGVLLIRRRAQWLDAAL